MRLKDVLIGAKALIGVEERWCQGWFAKDHVGAKVASSDPTACQWCALGAISRVVYTNAHPQDNMPLIIANARSILAMAAKHLGYKDTVTYLNDYSTHERIMALLREGNHADMNPLDKKRIRIAKDRQMALASAHVKLKLADDLVSWSLNQEIMDVLGKDEVKEVRDKLNAMFRKVWNAYSKESRD